MNRNMYGSARRPIRRSRGSREVDGGAVLPRALQRAEPPAKALARQRAERVGRLGPRDCALAVGDRVTYPPDRDGEVLVFGERSCVKPPASRSTTPPRADRAGDDRVCSRAERTGGRGSASDVLERLPPRDEVHAIADLGVAGDGATSGSANGRPARRGSRLELRVAVDLTTTSEFVTSAPVLSAAALPALSWRTSRTLSSSIDATISAVRRSTHRRPRPPRVLVSLPASERTARSIITSSLNAGTTIATDGSCSATWWARRAPLASRNNRDRAQQHQRPDRKQNDREHRRQRVRDAHARTRRSSPGSCGQPWATREHRGRAAVRPAS